MRSALRIKTKILPGNRIEISAPELPVGDAVEVIVLLPEQSAAPRSALELLEAMPSPGLFKTPEEADHYIQEERDSWDR